MNRISAEDDIRFAMRKFYAERIVYPKTMGFAAGTITEITGDVDGVPYGDIYEIGDVFTDPVGDGQLGLIYYVVHAEAGSNTLQLQLEEAQGNARPKVVLVNGVLGPEVVAGKSRVYIGVRSRPTARSGFVRALHAGRALHSDGLHVVLTEPFWRGGFWLHVEGVDRMETAYVFEMINSRQRFRTDVYKFDIDVMPIRAEVVNLEAGGVFRNVLTIDVNAALSTATPLDQLPDGMPEAYFPHDAITGVSPVIEDWTPEHEFPWYAERVGDFPTSQAADDAGVADIPPTE